MRKLIVLLGIVLLGTPAFAQNKDASSEYDIFAHAPAKAEPSTERLANGSYVTRIPFAALRSEWGDIRLLGASAADQVAFNIAPQAHVKSARLVMRHVNGLSQSDLKPQLRLAINNHFLAQLPGVTQTGAAINEVSIRPEMLQTGYNTLTLNAIQRYTLECQDPTAAELWTDIDTARSFFEVRYDRAELSPSLADLDAIITPGVGGVESLGIVTADDVTADDVRWGALVSQAIGNRLKYELPNITHLPVEKLATEAEENPSLKTMDLVLVGQLDDLSSIVSIDPQTVPAEYSYLSIQPSPFNPEHFMLVISGRTSDAVERGVIAFSAMNFPMDDTAELLLAPNETPAPQISAQKGPVRTDYLYSFDSLGLPDTSVLGAEHAGVNLNFELPSDTYFEEGEEFELALNFAYGANLEPTSVINIVVNGQFQRAIPLKNSNGEVNPGYMMLIEATALKPGVNNISFEVEMSAKQEGYCANRSLRHLAFVLKGSSTIRLPASSQLAVLPDLSLISETAYPYSGIEDASFAVVAADTDSRTLAATWLLSAKLAQLHGALFTQTEFAIEDVPEGKNILLVGASQGLKHRLPAELRLSSRSNVVTAQLISGATELPKAISARSLGDNGLVVSGEMLPGSELLLTVVTAQTPERLLKAVNNLVEPAFWSQLDGGAAIWRDHPATFVSQEPVDVFFAGTANSQIRVKVASGRAPWMWVLMFGVSLFAMASILALLARYMRSRID